MDRFTTWAAVVLGTLLLAWLQLSFDGLYDLDSYFHVRATRELVDHGVQRTLPQAAFSTWAVAYSDKDFLFHVFLTPFVSEEALAASGKWAVIALDFLVLASLALLLRSSEVRFGALWLLLFVAASPYLVMRFLPVRPHLLGMVFLAVEMLLLLRDRWKTLFLVAALHVWAHSSFPLALALALAWTVACLLVGRALPRRALGAVIAGLLLGSLVHPYFPVNLDMARQIFEVVRNAWTGGTGGIPPQAAGSELRPMAWAQFLQQAPGWVPALVGFVLLVSLRGLRGWSVRDLFFLLVTAGFLFMAWRSRRFLGEFLLASTLLAGALWTSLARGRPLREMATSLPSAVFVVLLAGGLGWAQWRVWTEVPRSLAAQSTAEVLRPDVERLDALAAPEEVVFHPSWMDFAYLYAFRPQGTYIAGLDPVFLFDRDPRLFRRAFALSYGRARDPRDILVNDFGARWIFVAKQDRYLAFRRLLARTPGIRRVHEGQAGEIWEVLPAPPAT